MNEFRPRNSTDTHREAHRASDVDFDKSSFHHTIGTGPNQAAAGNHGHSDLAAADHTHPPVPSLEVGFVIEYPVGTIGDDYLEYNGQSVLRADYPDLFALWGTTFGAADADHFNVGPDTADRVAVGWSGTKDVGQIGGDSEATLPLHVHEDAHTHTIAHDHTITHTHTISDHTHTISGQAASGSVTGGSGSGTAPTKSAYDGHAHGGETGAIPGTNPQTGASSDANSGASSAANSGDRSTAETGFNTDITTFDITPLYYATRKIVRALP